MYSAERWFSRVHINAILCADDIQAIADSWHTSVYAQYRFQTYYSTGEMFPFSAKCWTGLDWADRFPPLTGLPVKIGCRWNW